MTDARVTIVGPHKPPAPKPPALLPEGEEDDDDYLDAASKMPTQDTDYLHASPGAPAIPEDHADSTNGATPAGGGSDSEYTGGSQTYYNVAPARRTKKQKRRVFEGSLKLPSAKPRRPVVPTTSMVRRFKDLDADELQYNIEDVPPWYLCIALAFQHFLIMFGATVANVLALEKALCIEEDDNKTKAELFGTIFVCCGISTLLQTIIGCRLPVVQGGTFTFVTPSLAILSLEQWSCDAAGGTNATLLTASDTMTTPMAGYGDVTTAIGGAFNGTGTGAEPLWKPRIRELQGAIMVASIFEVLLGFTGLIGFSLRWIGPLAIAPTIALAGLALFDVAAYYASQQWWVALVTVVLIIAFSQYSKNMQIPCFTFKRGHGCQKMGFPIFRLFPVILAMVVVWVVCVILTEAGVFPEGIGRWQAANTHKNRGLLHDAPWIRFPYPGQWGLPTVSVASVFGMLAGVLASSVESVGDYYACARISGVPPPPMHAINRGIGIEGLACIICGAFGSSSGTTTYSENIGAIGITKVASRRVIEVSAVMMLFFGILNKFGAFFVTIPQPIIGGVFIVMFGMVTAVGISNLQFVDMNSSRNLFIIGFSFFFGLALPKYMTETKGVVDTGNRSIDQIFTVLLSTSMFVGGLSGFVLDNTIPGTDKERGLLSWRQHLYSPKPAPEAPRRKGGRTGLHDIDDPNMIYQMPFLTKWMEKHSWARYVPFLHTFDEDLLSYRKNKVIRKQRKRRKRRDEEQGTDDEGGDGNHATSTV